MDELISRQAAIDGKICIQRSNGVEIYDDYAVPVEYLEQLPPAQPEHPGKCKWCERLKERNLRIEYYWIDQEGCTASFSEPHIVATGIANFCPNCGAKMEVEDELQKTSND